ncbi:MAG TPA: agmatine deiminase [Steroidobacteraceae bacterium]|jgi:agmatine deiminase|nr:agmatine deiminase [Steroidobacteraceae bacterium]
MTPEEEDLLGEEYWETVDQATFDLREKTPIAEGYWMPAEFERHEATWLLWPERSDNWREGGRPAQEAVLKVAAAIRHFETVYLGVSPPNAQAVREIAPPGVQVASIEYDDAWVRDIGPTFVVSEQADTLRSVQWRFNAWGGLYQPFTRDLTVPREISSDAFGREMRDRYAAPIVLEGGAIHVDGQGTVLLTEECVLNANRNPGMTREQAEAVLRAYLGVHHFIWLGKGVFNDETSGHIDNLACFAGPGKVCLTWTDDKNDPQHAISLDAWERLNDARDARGRRLEVFKVPMPGPLHMTAEEARGLVPSESMKRRYGGDRLAASYVNFYFANGGIVMPLLDPRTDEQAAAVLRRACPERLIVGIPAREILLGGGGIHCITQQIPSYEIARTRHGPAPGAKLH